MIKIYTRNKKNGHKAVYFRINFRGTEKRENTGLVYTNIPEVDKLTKIKLTELKRQREKDLYLNDDSIKIKDRSDFYEFANGQFLKSRLLTDRSKDRYKVALVKFKKATLYDPLPFTKINKNLAFTFLEYLHKNKFKQNTIHKNYILITAIIAEAVKLGYLIKNDFKEFKIKKEDVIKSFLILDDLKKIRELDNFEQHRIDNKLELSKDIFIFACLTGLRISDLKSFNKNDVSNDLRFIYKTQFKTKDTVKNLPLHQYAKDILLKYNFTFPTISEFRLNKNLKIISKMASIDKNVSIHTARHTFICVLLDLGISPYVVKELAGHRNISTTMQYAKILDDNKIKAINTIPNF